MSSVSRSRHTVMNKPRTAATPADVLLLAQARVQNMTRQWHHVVVPSMVVVL